MSHFSGSGARFEEITLENAALTEGTHTALVRVRAGVARFTEKTISQVIVYPPISLRIATVAETGFPISCLAASDTYLLPWCPINVGHLQGVPSGGNGLDDAANYAYFWSNGANTQDISNLGPGSYSLRIDDAFNCEENAAVTL